jgi:NTE family protein
MKKALILSGGGARGSFQVGVMKYLCEMNWRPDIVCGTSIGAINAAAYGAGLSIDELINLWKTYHRKVLYRVTLPILLRSLKSRKRFSPMADTAGMRKLLTDHIRIDALRKSETEIIITAINMRTGQVRFFTHQAIDIDVLMAAGAIPGLFPWQYIDKEPYWDAGIMVNTPITPALKRGAKEIVVVLHSPVGAFPQTLPNTPMAVAELVFEQFLIGSYTALLPDTSWQVNPNAGFYATPLPDSPQLQLSAPGVRIVTVAPRRMLGFKSLLNFSPRQANTLIQEGYNNARMQLKGFFEK